MLFLFVAKIQVSISYTDMVSVLEICFLTDTQSALPFYATKKAKIFFVARIGITLQPT